MFKHLLGNRPQSVAIVISFNLHENGFDTTPLLFKTFIPYFKRSKFSFYVNETFPLTAQTLISFYSFLLLHFSNLRRLVHAMILKQPPREWIGTFRFV